MTACCTPSRDPDRPASGADPAAAAPTGVIPRDRDRRSPGARTIPSSRCRTTMPWPTARGRDAGSLPRRSGSSRLAEEWSRPRCPGATSSSPMASIAATSPTAVATACRPVPTTRPTAQRDTWAFAAPPTSASEGDSWSGARSRAVRRAGGRRSFPRGSRLWRSGLQCPAGSAADESSRGGRE